MPRRTKIVTSTETRRVYRVYVILTVRQAKLTVLGKENSDH